MPAYPLSDEQLNDVLTGLVVESLAVKQDFGTATVGCRECGETLADGDDVTAAVTCYADHSWEISGLYCAEHGVDSVAQTMEIRAENQVVAGATLESTGYLPPDGNFEADALTLGAIDVLDYSPTSEGY